MNVGDHYPAPIVGVLDYNFGNFFLEVTSLPAVVHDGVTPETTTAPAAEPARGRDVQRREPRPERPAGEVRPPRRA